MNFLVTKNNRKARSSRWLPLGAAIWIILLTAPRLARSDNFVFYFPKSHSILVTRSYGGVQYLPVLQLLNLFGQVGGLKKGGKSLEVWLNGAQIQFRRNSPDVRLNRSRLKLEQPVRVIEEEWMVPVDFVTSILPTLINQTVEYQQGENRIFVGGLRPNSFTLHMTPLQEGAQLTIQFTYPVNLRTAAQNGKWILYLGSHPVEPLESELKFHNPYVAQVRFDDQDGQPKLIITPAEPGLDFFPKLGEGGKVIVANILRPGAMAATQVPAPSAPAIPSAPQSAQAAPPTASSAATAIPAVAPNLSLPAVVLDAGHGGTDNGAQGKDGLLEKNLTLQLVARAQKALEATGKYRVVLTRNGDVNVGFDQRAAEANFVRPIAFISFHAGNLGPSTPRIVVSSYRPSSPLGMTSSPDAKSIFVNWDLVQLRYMGQSSRLAVDLQQGLERTTKVARTPPMELPVRVLQSIAAPAVAIEVGSLDPKSNSTALTNPSFQKEIGAAVATAIEQLQGGQQ